MTTASGMPLELTDPTNVDPATNARTMSGITRM